MADREQVKILKQGVDAWNDYRKSHRHININLRGANLRRQDLSGADFSEADIRSANFTDATLIGANFSGAKCGQQRRWVILLFILSSLTLINEEEVVVVAVVLVVVGVLEIFDLPFFTNFVTIGGTSFCGADLTEANFTRAKLSSTDLRKANLTHVRWYEAKMLDSVRPGDSYLKDAQLRKLLTGKGTDNNFNHKILRRINLQGAYLADASFIGADLSETNLQDADLSRAKLINTQLDGTNLTGACIKDWITNTDTNLENIICNYIYLKEYQQERRPSDPNRNFTPGEFAKLVEQSIHTVDLVFKEGIDWKAFLYSYQDIQVQYGDENVSIQAIEKKSDGAFVIRLSVAPEASKAKIESQIKQSYETKLKVLETQYRTELKAKDKEIEIYKQNSADILELAKLAASRPITVEAKAVAENQSKNVEVEMNFQAPVTGAAGKVSGDMNVYVSEQKQTLAEAAEEIQKLLKQLERTNPIATEADKIAHINDETSRGFKRRVVAALKAASDTAMEEFLQRSYVKVVASGIKAWMLPD